jgi:chromosome segregation ATPase
MWLVKLRLRLVLLLAGLLAVSALLWQAREISAQQRQHAEDVRLVAQYVNRLHGFELQNIPATRPQQAEVAPAPARARHSSGPTIAAPELHDAEIQQLRQELSGAHTNVGRLESRIATLDEERRMDALRDSERYAAAESEWKERLDLFAHQLESAQKEARSAHERVADLEAASAKSRNSEPDNAARAAEVARLLANLRELNRRREDHLTAILRRYRDLTNEFRAMSGVIGSSHDQNANAMSGPALTRIQSAVSMAEDDLHQINELSAQTQQIEKKLGAGTTQAHANR